jgi:hypothetical protein
MIAACIAALTWIAAQSVPTAGSEGGAVQAAAAELRAEIDRMASLPGDPCTAARVAFRRVTFDLLARGGAAGDDAQATAVAGLRLARARGALDALLADACGGERPAPEAVRRALERFAATAGHGLESTADPATPERALADVIAPLRQAVAILERPRDPRVPADAWPTPAELGAKDESPASTASRVDRTPAEEVLEAIGRCERPDASGIRADLRAAHAEIRSAALRKVPDARAWAEGSAEGDAPPAARAVIDAAADLARIESMQGWPRAVAALHAPGGDRFTALTRQWTTNLRAADRRDAARRSIDAFARELAAFGELALERDLRADRLAAAEAAFGRRTDLLREVDRLRAAWIGGWSDGRGSPDATAAMLRMARTTLALEAAADVGAKLAADAAVERWGGMSVSVGDLAVHPRAIAARAGLALEAMLARDGATADAHLGALEAELPVAWLAALLAERTASWTAQRPPVGSALAAAAGGPAEASWQSARRSDWMLFSRLAEEVVHARSLPDRARVDGARASMSGIAARLAEGMHPDGARAAALAELVRTVSRAGTAPAGGGPAGSGAGGRPAR